MPNRKALLLILLAIFMVAGSAMTLTALTLPSAQSLLTQSLERVQEVADGHLIAEFEFDAPQQTGQGTVEVWGQANAGPDGQPAFRLTVLNASEPELAGLTVVSDGDQFWLYRPADNKVVTGQWDDLKEWMAGRAAAYEHDHAWEDWERDMPHDFDPRSVEFPQTAEEAVAKLLEYVAASRSGTVEIGEQQAYVIRLVPIAEQMPDEIRAAGGYLNVWVRAEDSAPLGLEYVQGVPGSFRLAAVSLTLNQGVDESVFTFAIPDGTEVVPFDEWEWPAKEETAVAFEPLTPAELPAGAVLVDTATVRGAVVARYRLDEADFYIAQGPPQAAPDLFRGELGETIVLRDQEAILYQEADGDRLLLTWRENDVVFWVGGQLSRDQVVALAESLR